MSEDNRFLADEQAFQFGDEEKEKDRVYVDSPDEAPEGVQVQQGDQGGLWYPSEAVEGEGGEEEGGDDVEWVETEYGEVPDTDGPIPPDMRDEPIGSDSHPVLWKRPEGEEELNEYISEIQDTEWYGEGSEIFERAFHGDDNTEAEYTNEDGEWDEDRLEKHEEWGEELLNEDAATEEGEEPIGMILLGPPGAGKGWWQEQVEEGAYGETGEFVERDFTAISSDRTKEPIPEYDETNASEVHDEASKIAKENLAPQAIENEHNVIVDKVATTPDSTLNMIESMREKGYDVRANFVNVPTEKSVHNAVSRYYEEGRFTPLDYANGAGEASRESFNTILDEAEIPDEKAGRFDNDVEWGNAPEAEFVGEELLKVWYEFLQKYKGEDREGQHEERDDRTSRTRRDGSGDSEVHGGGLRRSRSGGHGEGSRGRGRGITKDDLVDAAQSILKDGGAEDFRKEWVSDPTEQAPNRWTNTETGEHRYQETKPGEGTSDDDNDESDGDKPEIVGDVEEPSEDENLMSEYGFDIDHRVTLPMEDYLDVGTKVRRHGENEEMSLNELTAHQSAVSEDLVEEYAETGEYDDRRIEVVQRDGKNIVVDGHHRLAAAVLAGEDEIPAKVIPEDKTEEILENPLEYSVSSEEVVRHAVEKVTSWLPLASQSPNPSREEVDADWNDVEDEDELADKFLERLLDKNRVYVSDPSEAPEGALVREGRSGTWFYYSNQTQENGKKRIYISSPDDAPEDCTVRGGTSGGYYYYAHEHPRGQR